jgi:uncharacterized SAM-binding protein YcdF (DUF218 family)
VFRKLIPTRALLALLLACAGCRLIDQRTFAHKPTAPEAAQLQRSPLPPLPLVTIRFEQPDFDWRTPLAEAVLAAQSRKPEVVFDVVTPIPVSAPTPAQDQAATQGDADARMVADALQYDGIPAERVHLGYRGDPGQPPREVRVYAR